MEFIQIIGLLCGCVALFFALTAGILYFKLKKFVSLITEDQLKQAMPIFEKQRRRLYTYAVISCVSCIATIVFSIILNI